MKVDLECTIIDYLTHRKYNVYRQEDGKFFVLTGPTNPLNATSENVSRFVVDTRKEALALCTAEAHHSITTPL